MYNKISFKHLNKGHFKISKVVHFNHSKISFKLGDFNNNSSNNNNNLTYFLPKIINFNLINKCIIILSKISKTSLINLAIINMEIILIINLF